MKCWKCGDRIELEHGQHWVHVGSGSMFCETLAEPMESNECPKCDREKDRRYRAELDRHDAIDDVGLCIDTMENVSFVNSGDALRVANLLTQLSEKYGQFLLQEDREMKGGGA